MLRRAVGISELKEVKCLQIDIMIEQCLIITSRTARETNIMKIMEEEEGEDRVCLEIMEI